MRQRNVPAEVIEVERKPAAWRVIVHRVVGVPARVTDLVRVVVVTRTQRYRGRGRETERPRDRDKDRDTETNTQRQVDTGGHRWTQRVCV